MTDFDFEQVRTRLATRGLTATTGDRNTLTLVPLLDGSPRQDLLATWGIDEQGHLYCDLTQSLDGPGSFDLLAALATTTPCHRGTELHVARLIADLMRSQIAALARAHPVPALELALSA